MVKKCLLLPLLAAAFIACSDDDDNNGGNNDGKETATFTYEFKTNQTVLDIADVTIRYMGADSVQHVDTLSDAITAKLANSSIGELIRWANVRGVDEKVLFILEDVKISDFFTALEYKDGTITVNMEKLLGVN